MAKTAKHNPNNVLAAATGEAASAAPNKKKSSATKVRTAARWTEEVRHHASIYLYLKIIALSFAHMMN